MNSALMLHRHASIAVAINYLLGAVAGALVSAAGLWTLSGLVSSIPAVVRALIVTVAVLALMAVWARIIIVSLPQRKYQIPRTVFHRPATVAARRFAFELGTGVRTYITNPSPYALALVVIGCSPAGFGAGLTAVAATAVGFGLGRSVVVALDAARSKVGIEPPGWALRSGSLLSLLAALSVGLRVLL